MMQLESMVTLYVPGRTVAPLPSSAHLPSIDIFINMGQLPIMTVTTSD